MRSKVSLMAALGAAALLAACGKSQTSTASSDQPAQPSEPAAAPAPTEPAALTDAEKKAALADLPAQYQTADLDNGQAKFVICKTCHTAQEGGADMVGPNLYGVFGRKAGSKPGFSYSDAMKASGIIWDADKINAWITKPSALVPGTKMTYVGMANEKDRIDLIAYLKTITSPKKS